MKRKTVVILLLLLPFYTIFTMKAESGVRDTKLSQLLTGLEHKIKISGGIGGTAPLPLPHEIRTIDHYSPGFNFAIEGNVLKWIDAQEKWGVRAGLRIESKAMSTKATVKNYGMEIINDNGGKLGGLWTGGVKTTVRNYYITLPILAEYKLSQRWRVSAGPYFSYLFSGEFSGDVYDGHLRTPDEYGSRVDFAGENRASYDFGSDLRKFQWGLQAGASWNAFRQFDVFADLSWGLNDIFKSDFKTVTFNLYPIYLNIGLSYAF